MVESTSCSKDFCAWDGASTHELETAQMVSGYYLRLAGAASTLTHNSFELRHKIWQTGATCVASQSPLSSVRTCSWTPCWTKVLVRSGKSQQKLVPKVIFVDWELTSLLFWCLVPLVPEVDHAVDLRSILERNHKVLVRLLEILTCFLYTSLIFLNKDF